MLLESVLLSIVLGYIRGGKILNLENVNFRGWTFFILAYALQSIAIYLNFLSQSQFYIVHMLSYFIILAVTLFNIRITGMFFVFLGTLTNALVIGLNRGQMPVKLPEGYDIIADRGHMIMEAGTQLSFLGDIFFLK